MSELIEVARTGEVPVGRARVVHVEGRALALYHTASGFYATDNTCPHRGGPLGEGDLIDDEITCPWHLWGFDVSSGVCAGNPQVTVATYEVQVDGDRILVRLP